MVEATDPKTGVTYEIPASQAVTITGPEIAAADAQMTAQVLLNLSTGLENLVNTGVLSRDAAGVAATLRTMAAPPANNARPRLKT